MTRLHTHTCPECHRVFDLLDDDDANEWASGHDCEPDDNTKWGVISKERWLDEQADALHDREQEDQ